jgi:hypothetical protein
MQWRTVWLLGVTATLGCGSAETPSGRVEARQRPVAAAPSASDALASGCTCGTLPGCPPCATSAQPAPSERPTPELRSAPKAFPPSAIAPPFERTAKPGDGSWSAIAVGGATSSPLAKTTLHPHGIRSDVVMELVAIDVSRLGMELVLGTEEPEGYTAAEPPRTGLVPPAALEKLVAVTNGGFKKRHGGHGIGVGGVALVPPRADFCTFAKTKDGAYRVGVWSALEAESASFAWFRQTPPCLVEGGVKSPDTMNEYKAKRWGGAEDGRKDIRRSAIGTGADPAILYFAIGDWVTSEWLANGLVAAGITTAAELDINYSYTRFIVYEHAGPTELVATSPLLKELKAPRKEYWSEPSARDFFFLAWR